MVVPKPRRTFRYAVLIALVVALVVGASVAGIYYVNRVRPRTAPQVELSCPKSTPISDERISPEFLNSTQADVRVSAFAPDTAVLLCDYPGPISAWAGKAGSGGEVSIPHHVQAWPAGAKPGVGKLTFVLLGTKANGDRRVMVEVVEFASTSTR